MDHLNAKLDYFWCVRKLCWAIGEGKHERFTSLIQLSFNVTDEIFGLLQIICQFISFRSILISYPIQLVTALIDILLVDTLFFDCKNIVVFAKMLGRFSFQEFNLAHAFHFIYIWTTLTLDLNQVVSRTDSLFICCFFSKQKCITDKCHCGNVKRSWCE